MIRATTDYYLVTTTRDPEATGTINVKAGGPNLDGTSGTGKNDTTV